MGVEVTLVEYLIVVILTHSIAAVGMDCPENQLVCEDHQACYQPTQRCDGKRDCADDSDEHSCTIADCPSNGRVKFCHSLQRCIDVWVTLCDCPDQCRLGETCCSDGSGCYTDQQKCDGTRHCINGADEEICVLASGPKALSKNSMGRAVISIILAVVILACVIGALFFCRYKQTRTLQRYSGSQWYDLEIEPTPDLERRTECVHFRKHEHYQDVREESPQTLT